MRILTAGLDPAIAGLIVAGMALLFAGAAFHKLRDLRRFEEIFAAYALLPAGSARLIPVLESCIAAGLLLPATRPAAAGGGILLLLTYGGAIAINLRRGRRELACGCGGPDDRRVIAGWMVWRNLSLAVLLATVLLPWIARPLGLTDAVTIGFGAASSALVYLCIDGLLGRNTRLAAAAQLS